MGLFCDAPPCLATLWHDRGTTVRFGVMDSEKKFLDWSLTSSALCTFDQQCLGRLLAVRRMTEGDGERPKSFSGPFITELYCRGSEEGPFCSERELEVK